MAVIGNLKVIYRKQFSIANKQIWYCYGNSMVEGDKTDIFKIVV